MKQFLLENPTLEIFEEFNVDSRKVKIRLLSIDLMERNK